MCLTSFIWYFQNSSMLYLILLWPNKFLMYFYSLICLCFHPLRDICVVYTYRSLWVAAVQICVHILLVCVHVFCFLGYMPRSRLTSGHMILCLNFFPCLIFFIFLLYFMFNFLKNHEIIFKNSLIFARLYWFPGSKQTLFLHVLLFSFLLCGSCFL